MKHSITCSLFIVFLVVILNCSTSHAATQVATVVAVRGNVQALDAQGKGRPLAIQSAIFEDETLKTGERSRVQIMFSDNTLINLGNATTMKIAEYRWQPEQNDGALKTQIKEGTFRIMGGALAKTAPQNFKTETPTATIGIRGSMYAGLVTPDFLSVVFQGGKGINITNPFGTVEIIKPGYGTKVALNKPPLPQMKFTAKELGELNKALSGNGAEENGEHKENGSAPKEEPSTSTGPTDDDKASLGGGETVTTPFPTVLPIILPVPDDIKKDVVVNNAQTTTSAAASITADSTAVTSTALTGNYRMFIRNVDLTLANPQNFNSAFLILDSGTVNANLYGNGSIQGSFLSNGTSMYTTDGTFSSSPFFTLFGPYAYPGYTPTATSYNGFNSFTDTLNYNDPDAGLLSFVATYYVDPTGKFFYNTVRTTIDSTTDLLIGSLVYGGVPSGSIPTTGIDKFTGHLIYSSPTSRDADVETTMTEINYYNKRLIGRSSDNNFQGTGEAVFFGSLAADGTATVKILAGGDPYGADVTAAFGTATATLYGSFYQGLAFTASGNDYSVIDNAQTSSWDATGAALRAPTTEINNSYPTSAIPYTVFLVGVADNTLDGNVSRIFMNTTPLSMSIDPTLGVVSGTINATELLGGFALTGLTVGGSAGTSAYVANDNMVAMLSGSNYTLKDYGNILVTAGPNAPEITAASTDFMTWGYWEMAYTDPNPTDGSNDHLFGSQSFFVAGQQTPTTYLDSILNTASFTGTYTGKAFGVQIDASGQNTSQLTNGTTNLIVNFQNTTVVNAVSGIINFDQASLVINSLANTLTNTGFNATVSTVSTVVPTSSAVNGAFFGPAADGVGGNFHALMGSGIRYLGIFGGSR